jgi:ribosomal protein L36
MEDIKYKPVIILDCNNITVIQKKDRIYVINTDSKNYKAYLKSIEDGNFVWADKFGNIKLNILTNEEIEKVINNGKE